MSEMTLDTAIDLLRQVESFDEYQKYIGLVLKKCSTHEEIETIKVIINEEKNRLLDTNTEFKAILDSRKKDMQIEADKNRSIRQAERSKSEAISRSRDKVSSTVSDTDVDEWVSSTKFKIVDQDELERRMDDKIGCPNPKCEEHGKNRGNTLNGIPTCMRCWHKLVPKSKFKEYNRAYWRRFNRKR